MFCSWTYSVDHLLYFGMISWTCLCWYDYDHLLLAHSNFVNWCWSIRMEAWCLFAFIWCVSLGVLWLYLLQRKSHSRKSVLTTFSKTAISGVLFGLFTWFQLEMKTNSLGYILYFRSFAQFVHLGSLFRAPSSYTDSGKICQKAQNQKFQTLNLLNHL